MIVQLHDVQTPEQPAAARGLEVRQELFQDGAALVLELVVQAEEGTAKLFFRNLRDRAGRGLYIVSAAYPKSDAMLCPFKYRWKIKRMIAASCSSITSWPLTKR